MVEVPGQADEAVADQRHPDQTDQEHQRDGLAHGADQALTVPGHRQGGPDQRDRQRQRDPERQPPPGISRSSEGSAGVLVVIDVSFGARGFGQQLQARRSAWVVSAGGRSP